MVERTRLQRKKYGYQIKSPEMEDKDILTVGDKQKCTVCQPWLHIMH